MVRSCIGRVRDCLPGLQAAGYGQQVTSAIVIGVVAKTGSAVAVALSGPAAAPRFRARREMELVPPGLPAQPYHTAAGLLALAGLLPASTVRAIAIVVKAVSMPDQLAGILRSHAWMHAAEGALYRQAVLAAATGCGWTTRAVSNPRCRPQGRLSLCLARPPDDPGAVPKKTLHAPPSRC